MGGVRLEASSESYLCALARRLDDWLEGTLVPVERLYFLAKFIRNLLFDELSV